MPEEQSIITEQSITNLINRLNDVIPEESITNLLNRRTGQMPEESITSLLNQLNDADVATNGMQLSWKERRGMGLTRFGIYRAVRQLHGSMEWNSESSLKLIAIDVAMVLAGNPKYADAWDNKAPELEWDAILEFIMKMLPIILKLLLIFMMI